MNFKLEPWEIPPGADANNLSVPIEFGPIDWNGVQTMISARTVEIPTTRNLKWNLALVHPHSTKTNFMPLMKYTIIPNRILSFHISELENIIIKRIKESPDRFGRTFYVAEQLCIVSQNKFLWSQKSIFFDSSFSTPEDMCKEPSLTVFQWLSQEWKNPDSEVRYAWEWSRKAETERRQYLKDNVPRWEELINLMRAIVCIEKLPKDAPWSLEGPINRQKYSAEALVRSHFWRELLKDKFIPFEPFPDSSPQCLNDYLKAVPNRIVMRGFEFSAHEQLEAKLYLRDWLQRNAREHLYLVQ